MAVRIDFQLKNKLSPFSSEIRQWVDELLEEYNSFAVSVPKRKRKLGDIRINQSIYRISLNNDLDPQHTLLVLLHEIAHAATFRRFGVKVNPHGLEWKQQFSSFLLHLNHLLGAESKDFPFPDKIKASSSAAVPEGYVRLKEIPQGQMFQLGQKIFTKGILRRTRYVCIECSSNRAFLVSAEAAVQLKITNPI